MTMGMIIKNIGLTKNGIKFDMMMGHFHALAMFSGVLAFQCGRGGRQQKEIESQPEAILSLKRPHNGQFR